MKLYYFPIPGRAETTRLMLNVTKTPFQDVRVPGADWPQLKQEKAPFGKMPFLELDDGRLLAQSAAIESYVARVTGLYPEDSWMAAKGDEVRGLLDDVTAVFGPTFTIQDKDEKIAKRQELMEGPAKELMQYITNSVAALDGDFFGGDKLVLADIAVFTFLSGMTSGFLDGIPPTLLDAWPVLKEFRNKVACEERVRAVYAEAEGMMSFKPEAWHEQQS